MSLMSDRYYSHEISLDEELTAYVNCKWIDSEPGHVAQSATVVVKDRGGVESEIGHIKGPISRDAANEQGAIIAENWYANQVGKST